MTTPKQELLRNIPAVDRLLMTETVVGITGTYPRSLLLKAITEVLDELREEILSGQISEESDIRLESIEDLVAKKAAFISRPSLRPLVNATGIVVHTNLGRSILAERVLEKIHPVAGGYSNLEYDLEEGRRGSRYSHVVDILKELTGAEAALVVNNNAAAVFIALETLAKGREVPVSRGQLVEIGGSFRIPDVMRSSGAILVDVGTTNKTHLRDYESVIGPETALLLKVHTSNYQIVGFTSEVPLSDLVKLGKKYGIPVMEDLGSGCFVDFSKYGIVKEPPVKEVLAQGPDLVTFSGDKLLGGPQAGIMLGKKEIIEAIRQNPVNRALRIDKMTLVALEETLRIYRDEKNALDDIPTLRMICEPYEKMAAKAERLVRMIGDTDNGNFTIKLVDGVSRPGGGSLPLAEFPSRLISLLPAGLTANFIEKWLRGYDPPIITRLDRDRVLLDVRTIQERELSIISRAINELASLS